MDILFVVGCIAAAVSTFAVMLWSPRPQEVWGHARGAARLAVFATALFSAAATGDGWNPPWESVAFVYSVAVAYAVQAYSEAARQREVGASQAAGSTEEQST